MHIAYGRTLSVCELRTELCRCLLKRWLEDTAHSQDEPHLHALGKTDDKRTLHITFTLPNLKPTTKTISLRLPQHLLDSLKVAANARDVPYQSLIKVWLQEKLHSQ